MFSVTQLIPIIKQPKGGYVPVTLFKKYEFDDGKVLNKNENIAPGGIGVLVDYFTRIAIGTPPEEAFKVALKGAERAGKKEKAQRITEKVTGVNSESIKEASKLLKYDTYYRTGKMYDDVCEPDEDTVENILIMVERSMSLWEQFGEVLLCGFTLPGARSYMISSGDGDFLTRDTLWDFKVSKNEPTTNHTLQLLIYYLLGISSAHIEFGEIEKLGIFNPRKNVAYVLNISDIDENYIAYIYSKEMLMDIIESAAIDHIKELQEEKIRKLSAKRVKSSKEELSYETYKYAVWDKGELIEKVPKKYLTAEMCYYAFCCSRFDDAYRKNDTFGLITKDLGRYAALIPDEVWSEEFAINFVGTNPDNGSFEFVPDSCRTDKVVAYAFAWKDFSNLDDKYKTEGFYHELVELNPNRLVTEYIPSNILYRDEYINAVVKSESSKVLKRVPSEYLDYDFFYEVVSHNCGLLKLVPKDYVDRKMCEKAIEERPTLIRFVPQNVEGYKDLCLFAVSKNWVAIKYVPKEFISDEIKEIAARQSEKAKKYFD